MPKNPHRQKTTSKEDKRYHVCQLELFALPIIAQVALLYFPYIPWFVGIAFTEYLDPIWTVVQLIERFPSIFKLCIPNPLYSVFDNTTDFVRIDDRFDFINIWIIVVHFLILVSPIEWLEECSVNHIVPVSIFWNFQLIGVGANSFNDLVRPYLLIGEGSIVASLYLKFPSVH